MSLMLDTMSSMHPVHTLAQAHIQDLPPRDMIREPDYRGKASIRSGHRL